jgi:hypothetical protein
MTVRTAQETPNLGTNLGNLQSASLKIVALFVGALGYAWLVPLVWGELLLLGPVAWAV